MISVLRANDIEHWYDSFVDKLARGTTSETVPLAVRA
jgi:hypothetical protein